MGLRARKALEALGRRKGQGALEIARTPTTLGPLPVKDMVMMDLVYPLCNPVMLGHPRGQFVSRGRAASLEKGS